MYPPLQTPVQEGGSGPAWSTTKWQKRRKVWKRGKSVQHSNTKQATGAGNNSCRLYKIWKCTKGGPALQSSTQASLAMIWVYKRATQVNKDNSQQRPATNN